MLTQAGPGFAEAAVTVLVDGLGFEPDLSRSPDKAGDDLESGGGGSGRPWIVAAGLSDSDCEQLLRCLPKQSELYARPAGTVSKNANLVRVPRWDSNSGGSTINSSSALRASRDPATSNPRGLALTAITSRLGGNDKTAVPMLGTSKAACVSGLVSDIIRCPESRLS